MTFRFETDYDLETLTAMAKGIRRTVRKKRSCLVHIFAALVVLMEAFFLLMDLRKNALDVGDVLALIAVLAIIIVVRTEDRLNARTARARLLPGTEHASTVFDEDGYTVTTSVNKGRWQYKQIFAVAETERYFLLTRNSVHLSRKRPESRSYISSKDDSTRKTTADDIENERRYSCPVNLYLSRRTTVRNCRANWRRRCGRVQRLSHGRRTPSFGV